MPKTTEPVVVPSWNANRTVSLIETGGADAGRSLAPTKVEVVCAPSLMDPLTPPEAQNLADFARNYLDDLVHAAQSAASPVDTEERGWLQAAGQRVANALKATDAALGAAWPLPELEAGRKRELRARQEGWGQAVAALYAAVVEHTSANGPLVEVLFSHCRFEKLSRSGAASDQFHMELQRRRRTQYVQRMSAEPEYSFLQPQFQAVDDARESLEECQHPAEIPAEKLANLKIAVEETSLKLSHMLEQARALANAALVSSPDQLISLGLSAKPRRRTSRKAAPKP